MLEFIFGLSLVMIIFPMIIYPISVILLSKFIERPLKLSGEKYYPEVTVMIVAHNEEKVIKDKLHNITNLNYPKEKLKIIVTSDNSTDLTNKIVKDFIENNPNDSIVLHEVLERGGKTNAQNEAQKLVTTEILIMTDANSMLGNNAIIELVKPFEDKSVFYSCGRLIYSNKEEYESSKSESDYWNLELKVRDAESRIQTITAGNGALYAIRNSEYIDVPNIRSHDSAFPFHAAKKGMRAVFASEAVVYEKAGESFSDEFKRKIRMNRGNIACIGRALFVLNFIKYRWFTYFYLGHRASRCALWFNHLLLFISSIILSVKGSVYGLIFAIFQIVFYLIAFGYFKNTFKSKYSRMIAYYSMTILAQGIGAKNSILGKNKAFWDKAESTR